VVKLKTISAVAKIQTIIAVTTARFKQLGLWLVSAVVKVQTISAVRSGGKV
jgi:hypothetical protein